MVKPCRQLRISVALSVAPSSSRFLAPSGASRACRWRARPGWSIPAGCVVTIALLALCVMGLIASRKIPSIDDPAAAAKGKRAGMLFGIIFGLEGGLIALSSTLLARYGLGIWIPIAAAVIVGVHFIPLAFVFEVPLYYWTGVLSVLGMLACSLVHDAATRVLCAGLVMAAVLWLLSYCYSCKRGPCCPRELRFETAKLISQNPPDKARNYMQSMPKRWPC